MKKRLIEKFDPSMPGWLRRRLLYTGGKTSRDMTFQSDDIHPRAKGDSQPSEGLYKDFISKNIDLNKAKFTSVDPQDLQKRNDPRLKEPYLPIFHLVGTDAGENFDTVYAVGINDTDKWPVKQGWAEFAGRTFRSIPLKRLLDFTKDFCYLDLDDTTNYLDKDKIDLRRSTDIYASGYNADSLDPNQRYDIYDSRSKKKLDTANLNLSSRGIYNIKSRDMNKFVQNAVDYDKNSRIKGYWNDALGSIDKSGYIRNPHKFDDALKKLKARNYSKVLNDVFSRLKTLQSALIQGFSDINFKNSVGNIDTNLFPKFNDAVSRYNDLVKYVDNIIRHYSDSPDRFSDSMAGVFSSYVYVDLMKLLKELEMNTTKYINVPVDWDVEEANESLNRKLTLSEDIDNMEDIDMSAQNPVMQNAVKQDKFVKDKYKDTFRPKLNKNNQKVIGADKQEVPDNPKEIKLQLDENLFNESKRLDESLKSEIHNYVYDALVNVINAQDIASRFKDYNPDWCREEGTSIDALTLNTLASQVVKDLFYNQQD